MNQTRRDLLKFFAAGTIITPLSGEVSARLIETPKVELVMPEKLTVTPFMPLDIVSAEVRFHMKDGTTRSVTSMTYVNRSTRSSKAYGSLLCEVSLSHVSQFSSPVVHEFVARISKEGPIS